jgi:predicted dinucleotide-binding enzyme
MAAALPSAKRSIVFNTNKNDSSCEKDSYPSPLPPLIKGKHKNNITKMKIGILGTGGVGRTMAERLQGLGHEVMLGTRDVNATMENTSGTVMGGPPVKDWLAQNKNVRLGSHAEAAAFGELIINATSGQGSVQALEQAGRQNLGNKVLLDISNPLDFSKGMPPTLSICNDDSLGEKIQREFPELRVVKGFNTLSAPLMVNPKALPERTNLFICGNDTDAKNKVRELMNSFGWQNDDIIDLGDITMSRGTEQILPIWVRLWGALGTPMFNFRIVKA